MILDDGGPEQVRDHRPALGPVRDLDQLAELYATPEDWWRANFVTTVDGAVTGADGRSGTINNAADKVVFDLLRALADVVVVGAGTARAEGYGPIEPLSDGLAAVRRRVTGRAAPASLVVVSASAQIPAGLLGASPGAVMLATTSDAPADALGEAAQELGEAHVLVGGAGPVDPVWLRGELACRGATRILCEGGPTLLRSLLLGGVLDELCLTTSPLLVGGRGPRLVEGLELRRDIRPVLVLEESGTLLTRWLLAP